jgi:hypothetical protein
MKRKYTVNPPLYYRTHDGYRYPVYGHRNGGELTAPIFPEHYTRKRWWRIRSIRT